MKRLGSRVLGLVVLVAGVGGSPASALASTGTLTIEGSYFYSYSSTTTTVNPSYTWYSESASVYISPYIPPYTCVDTWAGTTTAGNGQGVSCALYLSGSWWSGQYDNSGAGLRFTGGYYRSNGTPQPLELAGNGITWYAGPGTLTGTMRSNDGYAGPVTANYNLTPINVYQCGPLSYPCSPDYSYFSVQGEITLTLDYVVH